ncbi:olfactory receptor 52A1-like [Dasypus novemcinctus]|uniref:olfactory receptor 52A1-like n=1 Tax=Dasypus novemcinctus TaxID=9361 RepID=UPI00265D8541|nr:olfactory receptor 52A1-like [Dasypus novemcinctus]
MFKLNGTVFRASLLTLIGITGLESVQFWIGIHFCIVYVFALFGNPLLLVIIKSECSLHEPMYLFLAMLGATDIALSKCILPKMLGIWFHLAEVYFEVCLLQMWFIHTFQCIESGILLTMALGCYVAIWDPLRHATIFTHQLLTQIGVGVTLRAALLVATCIILIKCWLKFYWTTVVSHSYCEHMAIMKLAADDVWINKIFGWFVAFSVLGFDIIFFTHSYIQIFIAVFNLPQKETRLKAFDTYIAHSCIFLEFYLLVFFSFFIHRFGFQNPSYIHILLLILYLLLPPFLNPLVYRVKTKQIRDRVSKLFHSKNPS